MKYTYTFLLSLLSFTFAFSQTTTYCNTNVTHFNIADHPGSIMLTIENSGANSISVTATSKDDVIDLLLIESISDGGTTTGATIADGVATAEITWASMPATATFTMLWSDEASPGNQMLNAGTGNDGLGNVDTSNTCPEAPESEKKYVHVTVPGSDENTSVRLVGPWWGNWDPNGGPVGVRNTDGTYTFTFDPAPTETMEFKVLKDGDQEDLIADAAAGNCAAAIDAGNVNTDYSTWGNRYFKVDDAPDMYITFSSCSSVTFSTNDYIIESVNVYPNPVKNIARILASETIEMVRIYDLTGRMVKQASPNTSEFNLDVADFSKGAYLVKLNAGNKEATTKFIK